MGIDSNWSAELTDGLTFIILRHEHLRMKKLYSIIIFLLTSAFLDAEQVNPVDHGKGPSTYLQKSHSGSINEIFFPKNHAPALKAVPESLCFMEVAGAEDTDPVPISLPLLFHDLQCRHGNLPARHEAGANKVKWTISETGLHHRPKCNSLVKQNADKLGADPGR